MKELKIDENPWWSPTRIRIMEDCKKKYWFEYIFHLKHKVPSSFIIGKHNHKINEKMWLEEPYTKKLIPGYKSYESCVKISVRDWKFKYAKTGECEGMKIEWNKYDANGWGKRLIGRIAETAGISYTRAMNEEPRLKSELEMKVEFDGIKIMARVDELRKNLVIRDHKSGREEIKEYFLKKNIQMTLCAMCLFASLQESSIASEIYSQYKGISLNEFLDALVIEINDIYPRVENGVHKSTSKIYLSKRTEKDFNDAIEIIEAGKKTLKDRDFHPSKENCDFCVYKRDCDKYEPLDYHENEYEKNFPLFASVGILINNCKPKVKKRRLQKTFRFKSKI